MAKLKTYVLVSAMHPTAPIYMQINKTTRQRIDKLENWAAYLKSSVTVVGEDGVERQRILRLKLNSNSVWQDEQIKEGILANEKFTAEEYKAVKFKYGVNQTNREIVQKFLEASPQFVGFDGYSQDAAKCFNIYDRDQEVLSNNNQFKQRLAAANKVAEMDLVRLEELILQIFGSGFKLPDGDERQRLAECQNILVDHIDDSPTGIQDILLERGNADDRITILIGKAVNLNVLSFTDIAGAVAMKRSGSWVAVKLMSDEYDLETKQRYFTEFLLSQEGMFLKTDLEKEVSKASSGAYQVPVNNRPVIEDKVKDGKENKQSANNTKVVKPKGRGAGRKSLTK